MNGVDDPTPERRLQCPDCNGEGEIPLGEVSRDMAIDGGDLQLQGQIIFGQCPRCRGDGWIEDGADGPTAAEADDILGKRHYG